MIMAWVEGIRFSREVAVLVAQVAPILAIAFVVEVRAIGERRQIEGKDSRVLLWIAFGSLTVLLWSCLRYVNGPLQVFGMDALIAWTGILSLLGIQIAFVAAAAWAALRLASMDAIEEQARSGRFDRHLREPGWKWLLRGGPQPSPRREPAEQSVEK